MARLLIPRAEKLIPNSNHKVQHTLSKLPFLEKYHERLKEAIAQALREPKGMRYDWIRILQERSIDEWASTIAKVTLESFKYLLARSYPPTFSELVRLGNIDTNKMGVYLDVIRQVDGQGKKIRLHRFKHK